MILKTLHLHNFRNYDDEFIEFSPHINFIWGENAQGKTNLLEAIFLLSTGRSFRTPNLKDLIKNGKKHFLIKATIIKDEVSQIIKIYYDIETKKIFHNSTKLPNLLALLGIMPSIVHCPQDIEIISGIPSFRRKFINIHLAQIDPIYVHHLARYDKSLKQRNCLLKKNDLETIDIWENTMAKSASYISTKRDQLINRLNKPINDVLHFLSDKKEKVLFKYLPSMPFDQNINILYEKYLEILKKNRKKDLLLKSTQIGPHRDDAIFFLNSKPFKINASEGQKRTLVSSLKLAELKMLQNRLNSPALMCMDDFGVHLDPNRQNKLIKYVSDNLKQVFLTLPQKNTLIESDKIKYLEIINGQIKNSTFNKV